MQAQANDLEHTPTIALQLKDTRYAYAPPIPRRRGPRLPHSSDRCRWAGVGEESSARAVGVDPAVRGVEKIAHLPPVNQVNHGALCGGTHSRCGLLLVGPGERCVSPGTRHLSMMAAAHAPTPPRCACLQRPQHTIVLIVAQLATPSGLPLELSLSVTWITDYGSPSAAACTGVDPPLVATSCSGSPCQFTFTGAGAGAGCTGKTAAFTTCNIVPSAGYTGGSATSVHFSTAGG
jgi:hypothetical protein